MQGSPNSLILIYRKPLLYMYIHEYDCFLHCFNSHIIEFYSKRRARKRDSGVSTDFSETSMYATWYPTLEIALLLLSRIYRCVEMSIFEGLAQETVNQTTETLQTASGLISGKTTTSDGYLFLIKHLLILREQIAPFDIEFYSTEKVNRVAVVILACIIFLTFFYNNVFLFDFEIRLLILDQQRRLCLLS